MPKAKVIYSKRHPLDHILSMLKANLVRGNDYTGDVCDAARALVACEKTMIQYRNKYPNYRLTNNYDALVTNPKQEIQKIMTSWVGNGTTIISIQTRQTEL